MSFEPRLASTMPGSCFSICFVRSPFIGRLMIFGGGFPGSGRRAAAGPTGRTGPARDRHQTGTPSIERKVFSYSSREKSGTFFCQMSQVLQREGRCR